MNRWHYIIVFPTIFDLANRFAWSKQLDILVRQLILERVHLG